MNYSFDLEEAQLCASFSLLVYNNETVELQKLSELGAEKIKWFSYGGTEAFGCLLNNKIYICFRGTQPNSLRDIIADLKAFKTKSVTGGRVHDGFKDALNNIWNDLYSYYEEHKFLNPSNLSHRNVICTGHSLGAALATLASKRFSQVNKLYTFGSPRVGDRKWLSGMHIAHWRFVNNNDIVTTVPSCLRFAHHGNLVYINHYGNIRKLTAWQRIKDKFRGHISSWKQLKFFDSFSDHSMEKYYNILHRL